MAKGQQIRWTTFDSRELVQLRDGTFLPVSELSDEERAFIDIAFGRVMLWVPHGRELTPLGEAKQTIRSGKAQFVKRSGGITSSDLLSSLAVTFGTKRSRK